MWVALCVAAVANGATFWLKRTGWLEADAYYAYLGQITSYRVTSRLDPAHAEMRRFQWQAMSRLYAVTGTQPISKLAKFAVVTLVIAVSLWGAWRTGLRPAAWTWFLLLVFTALVLCGALVSWMRFGGLLLVPGLRSFTFLAVALSATWLSSTKSLTLFSKYLIGLLSLQVILIPPEIMWGLEGFTRTSQLPWSADRITGTFLQPTTLGLFAVIALMFYVCFTNPPSRPRVIATGVSGIVVLASTTASALLLYLLVVGYLLVPAGGVQKRTRIVLILVSLAVVLALPWLTGRPDVFASLFGRIQRIQVVLSEEPGAVTVLFGQGLGVGTNAAVHWLRYAFDLGVAVPSLTARMGSDSTIQSLISQIGVVGCVGFYGLLAQGAWVDARARPLYAVIGLASLVINIIEFFPVNVLLGLLLAHSAATMQGIAERRKTLRSTH